MHVDGYSFIKKKKKEEAVFYKEKYSLWWKVKVIFHHLWDTAMLHYLWDSTSERYVELLYPGSAMMGRAKISTKNCAVAQIIYSAQIA